MRRVHGRKRPWTRSGENERDHHLSNRMDRDVWLNERIGKCAVSHTVSIMPSKLGHGSPAYSKDGTMVIQMTCTVGTDWQKKLAWI